MHNKENTPMKRFLFPLFLLAILIWPLSAQSTSKVGIVDGEKLFDEYPSAQDATKKISDAQDELKNVISDSEKIFEEFEKQKKSEAEKLTKQKELQAKIDIKAKDTRKMIESLSAKIEQDIVQAIRTIALEKGLDVVFDKRAVLYGGVDITQPVTDSLKKRVPIANQVKSDKKDAN